MIVRSFGFTPEEIEGLRNRIPIEQGQSETDAFKAFLSTLEAELLGDIDAIRDQLNIPKPEEISTEGNEGEPSAVLSDIDLTQIKEDATNIHRETDTQGDQAQKDGGLSDSWQKKSEAGMRAVNEMSKRPLSREQFMKQSEQHQKGNQGPVKRQR